LIDYIDVLRERDHMDRREALVQGGLTRFRPVVLTALTTALGLAPLAIGLSFDFFGLYTSLNPELYWGGEQAAWWGPMAIAIIAGILFATFLTLILVPVMYSLIDDATDFVRRHFLNTDGADYSAGAGSEDEAEAGAGKDSGTQEGVIPPPPVTAELVGATRERVQVDPFSMPGLDPRPDAV
jgi:hypothetical protein